MLWSLNSFHFYTSIDGLRIYFMAGEMSWNLPIQWLLLHPMCAEQSYCLWQGYYPRRVMVIDTMSCCLPATCSAFFLTDSCMLEIQLFWVNSSCQKTKCQRSNFAKAFSCFCVLGVFLFCCVLFCFSLKEPARIGSRWFGIWQDNINSTGLLLLLLAAQLPERQEGGEQPGVMQGNCWVMSRTVKMQVKL